MDQLIHESLWTLLSTASAVIAIVGASAFNGGVFHLIRKGTEIPVLVFTRVIGENDYVFQGSSSKRFVYMVQAYAQDTATATGQSIASALKEAAADALTDADLNLTGYDTLLCQPKADMPQTDDGAAAQRSIPTYCDGFLLEFIVAPTS